MTQQAVIFDVDGVLVDSYQPHFRSWQAMLAEHSIEFTEPEFRAPFGRTSRDIILALCGDRFPMEQLQAFDDRKEAFYRDIIRDDFPAVEGAAELIDSLYEAGFALAVGSSGPTENVALALESLGCARKISARVTGSDVTRGKPDPQVFQMAAQQLGVEPRHCAVVEDASAGVEAANRAEMTSIGLTGTATREQLAHADFVVDHLHELTPKSIQGLFLDP